MPNAVHLVAILVLITLAAKVYSALHLEERFGMDTAQVLSLVALPVLVLLLFHAQRTIASLRKQVAQLQLQLATKQQ